MGGLAESTGLPSTSTCNNTNTDRKEDLEEPSSQPPECSICLCELKNGETVVKLRICVHRFHKTCISDYFKQRGGDNMSCPNCRGNIYEEEKD